MVDLSKVIDESTFLVSDTHLGHFRVLMFEPVRLEYLADYNFDVIAECNELLSLLQSVPLEEHREHKRINELAKFLIDRHDDMIIEKWNTVISENSTVLHLGDFAFRNVENFTKRLNGKKILLRGNHDLKSARHYIECGWKDVIESVKMNVSNKIFEMVPRTDRYWNGFFTTINDLNILFSHYPIFNSDSWDIKKYGQITNMLEEVFEGYGGDINIHGHTHSNDSEAEICINTSLEKCNGMYPVKLALLLENVGIVEDDEYLDDDYPEPEDL